MSQVPGLALPLPVARVRVQRPLVRGRASSLRSSSRDGSALERPRLFQALDACHEVPLILIPGGPGGGKTTLVNTWVDTLPAETVLAWYELAEEDDDEHVFLCYLLASLLQALPNRPQTLEGVERVVQALALAIPGETTLLAAGGRPAQSWHRAADSLLNLLEELGPLVLVLDDVHRLQAPRVLEVLNYLLRYTPQETQVVLLGRRVPPLADWTSWEARGRALVLDEPLTFTLEETRHLLERRGLDADASRLWQDTGGWPLALDLLSRTPASVVRPARDAHRLLLDTVAREVWPHLRPEEQRLISCCGVASVWTPEVWAGLELDEPVQDCLERLVHLGLLQPTGCADTFRLQPVLQEFLDAHVYRDTALRESCHLRVAQALLRNAQALAAFDHLLAAASWDAACEVVLEQAPVLLAQGRAHRVLALCERLGDIAQSPHPRLRLLRARAHRAIGAFEAALADLLAARREADRLGDAALETDTLSQEAAIYIDTVQPARATVLLRTLFRRTGRQEVEQRARLLDWLAENSINEGRAHAALRYRRWSRSLLVQPRPGRLDVRLLLRTGQLAAARQALQETLDPRGGSSTPLGQVGLKPAFGISDLLSESAQPGIRPPQEGTPGDDNGHRDGLLIRAWIGALEGVGEAAAADARGVVEQATRQGSPYTEAVAWMRLGHALQCMLPLDLEAVLDCYARADSLAERLGVQRLLAESLMGRALACSRAGQVPASYAHATEGLAITRSAGDAWLSAWLQLAAGISGWRGGHPATVTFLDDAHQGFARCHDSFGLLVCRLWRCLYTLRFPDDSGPEVAGLVPGSGASKAHASGQSTPMAGLDDVMGAVQAQGYGFLLDRITLFGPDPVVLAQELRARGLELGGKALQPSVPQESPQESQQEISLPRGTASTSAGKEAGVPGLVPLPSGGELEAGGTTKGEPGGLPELRVQSLGPFRVWLQGVELPSKAFKREKARELFLILLTARGSLVQKDTLLEWLWPEATLAAAQRDFRVALHALSDALDPKRPAKTLARCLERRGQGFALRRDADLVVDADELEALLQRARHHEEQGDPEASRQLRQRALEWYRGDYLEDHPYAEWSQAERQRLRQIYLQAAESLAHQALEAGDDSLALAMAEAMLRRDRGWEVAYRIAMQVHARQQRRFLAARVYEECVAALLEELGVEPSDETRALYDTLLA